MEDERAEREEAPQVLDVARPGTRRSFLNTIALGGVAGGAAAVSDSCTPTSPGPSATTTTSSTTSSSTTTSIAANPVGTLYGYVRDSNGRAVVGARVAFVDGANAGKSSTSDGNGYYSIPNVLYGGYTVRVTSSNGTFLRDFPVSFTGDRQMDLPVTTTSTSSVGTTSVSNCACDLVHYWYPN
jgi:hypothetical protein